MLFASRTLVRRIEWAEAQSLRALVEACIGSTFCEELADGIALCRGAGSPLNKIVGLGFAELEEDALARVEQRYLSRGVPVHVELPTHAAPALTALLIRRKYVFTGFENVLGRALSDAPETLPGAQVSVRRATPNELDAWVDVLVSGFTQPAGEERAAAHDTFGREELEGVFRDMAEHPTLERWIAYCDEQVAGAASVSMQDGVLQLFGAATLPAHRRRGVQGALLAARLNRGRESGCELAVVTTQPGSQSQHNVERAGFRLLYARAVWQLSPDGTQHCA